ncbi:hypothetical protein LQV05_006479 [Cryptococcus neoformans]|nr:hypothetical protein LQV05_006479 [Cryptococcus neoformans]
MPSAAPSSSTRNGSSRTAPYPELETARARIETDAELQPAMGLPPARSAAGPSIAREEQSDSPQLKVSGPKNGKKDGRQYTVKVVREHLVPVEPKQAFLRAMAGDTNHNIPNDRLCALVEAVRLDGDAKRVYVQQAATAAHLVEATCELHRVCRQNDRSDPRLQNAHRSLQGT